VRSLLERYARLRFGPPAAGDRSADIAAFRRSVGRLRVPRAVRLRST